MISLFIIMAVKAIIFDIGGVVVYPGTMHHLRKALEKLTGVSESKQYIPVGVSWRLWSTGRINQTEFINRFKREFNLTINNECLVRIFRTLNKPNKGVLASIKKLKRNYKIYALTNHGKEWFEYERKKFGLDKYFDFIFTSYNLKIAKPNPKIYKTIIQKIKLKPKECIFVDNNKMNILTAKLLGFKTIYFRSASQLKKELKKAL